MRKRMKWTRLTLAVLLALAAMPSGASAQQGHSPLAGQDGRQDNHPDASRWPGGGYQETAGSTRQIQPQALAMAGAASSEAARAVDTDLPEGLSLRQGTATQVMGGSGSPADAAAAPLPENIDREQIASDSSAIAVGDASEKWFVIYPINYKGVPVAKYSDVLTVVDGTGEMLYLRKRNLPTSLNASKPTVGPKAAVGTARRSAGNALDARASESTPALEVWVEPTLEGQLSWTFTLSSSSPTEPVVRRYWVSAVGQPRVLHWEDEVYHTHAGVVSGQVWDKSPFVASVNHIFQDLNVSRLPGGDVSSSGSDGRYSYPIGNFFANLTGNLKGPECFIQDMGGNPLILAPGSGAPPAIVNLNFAATGEFPTAQTSAFYWTNATYQVARSILDPLPGKPFANLPTKVNINSSCNAFWNGSSINFYKAGGACPNTAYSDVVAHEYGHGIDHWRGGILDGGYSEGFGDAIAILVTRQSCLGRDFNGAGSCLRPATDVNLWPPGVGEGVHSIGKRYAQFTWQLVQELKKTYSEEESFRLTQRLVLASAAGNPSSIPDAVKLSFIADDTDGNLANGTPHCRQLAAAADSRTIPHPSCPPDRLGYAWADNPAVASYAPSATYSFNSAGGPIVITRSAVGSYAVRFTGLGGNGLAGGNVQVTPYGSNNEICKVVSWGSSGPDFLVSVRCVTGPGAAVDSKYTVLVTWR